MKETTSQKWQRAALYRIRVVHTPTGQAGNLVDWGKSNATVFIKWDYIGAAKLPVFKKFPKNEMAFEVDKI